MENNRIIIIDGNSVLNRAYYAMQRPMTTKEGLYTQGVYGFLTMLSKIRRDYPSDFLLVAFDRKAKTFRHESFAEYKAGRKKMPEELAMQLPVLKEILDAMGIRITERDGVEADDLIGSAAKRAEEEGLEPLIITGDKDALQLATRKTRILITKKGISEFDLYDQDEMLNRYGFTPRQFIDFKGLMGDASDNIPGVPGVGEKTALKLIRQFGGIEAMLEAPEQIESEKLRTKILENSQLALMSKKLATIVTDLPLDFSPKDCVIGETDYEKLVDLYTKLEFNSFLKKLEIPEKSIRTEAFSGAETPEPETVFLTETARWKEAEARLEAAGELVLKIFTDNNHRGAPVIDGVCLLAPPAFYFAGGENTELLTEIFRFLAEKKPGICGHGLIRDYYGILASGLLPETAGQGEPSVFRTAFDTQVAQYVMDSGRSGYDLKTLMLEYFHREMESEGEFLKNRGQTDLFSDWSAQLSEYGKKWCLAAEALRKAQEEKLTDSAERRLLETLEFPLIEVLASMETAGFATDLRQLSALGEELEGKISLLTGQIHEMAGETFNVNSPAQLGVILFEKLGLPAGKKTKTGYSTGAEVLERLRDVHPIAALVLEYRMLSKLKSTYIDGLAPLADPAGRIRPHFRQTVAATGRLSCTDPNLQNIPVKQEYGRNIRKAFVASGPEFVLIGADYSQIELRVLAHLSGDAQLIEAFNHGDDIHAITASRVFGVPEEEVTLLQRSNAKAVNFGVIYGMSGFGLSTELNIPIKEAERYIQEYFRKYTGVKAYMDGLIAFCRNAGYVETLLGRKRWVPEISSPNYMVRQLGERLAMNSPIQGSAADIIKVAMLRVYEALRIRKAASRLILQVHDELILEVRRDEREEMIRLVRDAMESAADVSVRLAAEVREGGSWFELK